MFSTTPASETPIACDPNALTPDQQERWMEVGKQLYQAVQEIRDLPDGYAFRLPNDSAMLMIVAEDLNFERLCCPFLRFSLEVEPNRGPFWLRMTGGEGIKEFLRMAFEAPNLIDEEVAKAAGFSISARTDLDSVETAVATVAQINERFAQAEAARQL